MASCSFSLHTRSISLLDSLSHPLLFGPSTQHLLSQPPSLSANHSIFLASHYWPPPLLASTLSASTHWASHSLSLPLSEPPIVQPPFSQPSTDWASLSWPHTLSLHSLETYNMSVSNFSIEENNLLQTPVETKTGLLVMRGCDSNPTIFRCESLIRGNILWMGFEAKHWGKRLENSEKKPLIKQLNFSTQRN